MFKWLTSFGNNVRSKAEVEIALARLDFLAKEYEHGRDRKVDVWYWKEQLDDLGKIHIRHDAILYSAQEAYRILFGVILKKYGFKDDITINEFTQSIKNDEYKQV